MEKRIYFSKDCCDDGGNDTRKEFQKNIKSTTPGSDGRSIPGPPGPNNTIVPSQIGSTGGEVPGNDESLDPNAIAGLAANDLNLNARQTLKATLDNSDITNPVWYLRISNALINMLYKWTPRLFKSGGTAGQVPVKIDGTNYNWSWQTLTTLIKNPYLSSSTTSATFGLGSITVTIGTGLQFGPNVIVAITKTSDPSQYMVGIVSSYDANTGVLIFNCKNFSGTGSNAVWTVNIGHTTFLPDQTAKSGYILSTDGINPFWAIKETAQPGDIIPSMAVSTRPGSLLCDGSQYTYDPNTPNSVTNPYKNLVDAIGAATVSSPWYVNATTFRVPDYRGRSPYGVGGSTIPALQSLGGTGGAEDTLIALGQTPEHTHHVNLVAGTWFDTPGGGGIDTVTSEPTGSDTSGINGLAAAQTVPGVQNRFSLMDPKLATYFYIKY